MNVTPTRLLAGALVVAALLGAVAGCDPLADATWFRLREFDDPTSKLPVQSVESSVGAGGDDTVNVVLENRSALVGASGSLGTGITVTGAHVAWAAPGIALPGYDFPATLFVPATAASVGTATGAAATLYGFTIVPRELKTWIAGNVPAAVVATGFRATATVTVRGRSELGGEAETRGSLSVSFTP